MFKAMNYEDGCLSLIDQRQLPVVEIWIQADNLELVAKAIEDMVVRGAPAIGCAAGWGMAVDAVQQTRKLTFKNWGQYQYTFKENLKRLAATRPTAVNLFYALKKVEQEAETFTEILSMDEVAKKLVAVAQLLETDDIRTCMSIGNHGASQFTKPISVLTHCNTGSLATAGYGTALGIIRSLWKAGNLKTVFVDETRPYLQGSRLTAFELLKDQIPYKLISDNMAAYAMSKGWVDLVVIGADRIASNGDTANKIGSYNLAVLCQYHKIPFFVAAPNATIDRSMRSGEQIIVEERPSKEILEIQGLKIAPPESKVWNPSFDVTPASLISAIVTEDGVFRGPYNFS